MIIQDLESKGWKVTKKDNYLFAERTSTGKLACFIPVSENVPEIEIFRIWTSKKIHPFLYKEEYHKVLYFDCLSNEGVKNP